MSPKWSRRIFAALMGAACALAASNARADRPTITLGGGASMLPAAPGARSTLNVLMRVGIDGVRRGFFGFPCMMAVIEGDLVTDFREAGLRRLPYMEVAFTGVQCSVGDGIGGGMVKVAPGQAWLDVGSRGQMFRLRLDAIGYEKNWLKHSPWDDEVLVFVKLAVDAIGLKMVQYLAADADFVGINVGAVSAEVGTIVTKDWARVRIAFGGRADLSIGQNAGDAWAWQSDLELYNEISADVRRYLRLFIRNSFVKNYNTGLDEEPIDYRLLGGAAFIF